MCEQRLRISNFILTKFSFATERFWADLFGSNPFIRILCLQKIIESASILGVEGDNAVFELACDC